MAILITGTPGVGKTTVANLLAKKMNKKYISLRDIILQNKLYTQYDKKLDSYIVDIEKTKKFMEQLLSCKEVVDTHLVEALPPSKIKYVIVLRLNPDILYRRLKNRGYIDAKIKQNIEAEILDLILADSVAIFGKDKVFEIDTTMKNPEDIVDIILDILNTGKGSKPGLVDWLEKYSNYLSI